MCLSFRNRGHTSKMSTCKIIKIKYKRTWKLNFCKCLYEFLRRSFMKLTVTKIAKLFQENLINLLVKQASNWAGKNMIPFVKSYFTEKDLELLPLPVSEHNHFLQANNRYEKHGQRWTNWSSRRKQSRPTMHARHENGPDRSFHFKQPNF